MFSGIVEGKGIVRSMQHSADACVFVITPQIAMDDLKIGDSVSVNGVCLTITELLDEGFSLTAVPETLRLTNLSYLTKDSEVNLERALLVGSRNGGHNVQGHVDGIGTVLSIDDDGTEAWLVKIAIPQQLSKYLVNKGFITIDGMSITIIEAAAEYFTVTLIPHTRQVSIAKQYSIGSKINIEVDIMAKYIEQYLSAFKRS